MSTSLITKQYTHGGISTAFTFREDGWFNMTHAAKAFGKRLQNFLDNHETKDYVRELAAVTHSKESDLSEACPGRYGGTWAHPKLAVFFARWLDVRDFLYAPSTQEYEEALSNCGNFPQLKESLNHANQREFLSASRGRYGGTWAHPKLAVFFARWLKHRIAMSCLVLFSLGDCFPNPRDTVICVLTQKLAYSRAICGIPHQSP